MTQGEDSCLHAKERCFRGNCPCRHLDLGLPASGTGRAYSSAFKSPSLMDFVLALSPVTQQWELMELRFKLSQVCMWGLPSVPCTVYLPQTHQVLYVCGVAWPCGFKKSKENCLPSLLSSENECGGWELSRDQEKTLGILWGGTPICNL